MIVYKISIHALTKRATEEELLDSLRFCHFNPRSHEESDIMQLFLALIFQINFNPRSHEESDPQGNLSAFGIVDFNPRSHEESDKIVNPTCNRGHQFQSTLSRRERL